MEIGRKDEFGLSGSLDQLAEGRVEAGH